jgi:oxygen-independent coproporphyrinogen III oxidase
LTDGLEITLEANPDDLSEQKIDQLRSAGINRLSIGIQSFFESDLKLMNRAHNELESRRVLDMARPVFDNISIDLIYGIPGSNMSLWQQNVEWALDYDLKHISAYALTVEPKTALQSFIKKGIVPDVDDDQAKLQFEYLVDTLESNNYEHYELSNFAKPGWYSKNNSAYWQGKTYLGVGPSAHSFDGSKRRWNIRNNIQYIKNIEANQVFWEEETLTTVDRYNELVMTGLRTIWGVDMKVVEERFGPRYKEYLLEQAQKHLKQHLLFVDEESLKVSRKGRFFSDGISADLFMLNLK